MDFELTEEQKMLKQTARDFLEREISPQVNEFERRRTSLSREESQRFIKQLIPLGYVVGPLPEEYGGANLSQLSYGLLLEELARAWNSLAGIVFIDSGLPRELVAIGTDEQKKEFLPLFLSGDSIGCSAITEPNHGSDSSYMETTAVLDNDEWIINGTKCWISNGTIADIASVVCVTDPGKGRLGMSTILVDKKVSPFETRELRHLGNDCFSTAELTFTDCRVPKRNLFGASGEGYRHTMREFEIARTSMAVMALGGCEAAVEAAINYARERKQFGKPIGSFQLVQNMIADMVTQTELMRLWTYYVFDLIDKGERARWQSSMAKSYACEAAVNITSLAIQVHGAMGLSDEYPVERYFRDARMGTIPDGTTQIQKLVMGRELIGIKAFV